jgi:DNA-binding transcriptional ArsR family regulator
MKERKVDVILHPMRLKIIQKFLGGQEKTAKELAQELPEIPQATLYRHLDKLVKTNILTVVDEKQIRGTVEKVYKIDLSEASMGNKELTDITKEEHLKYFMFFAGQLIANFEAYLQQEDIDFERDGVGFRQTAFYLSDEEFKELYTEIGKAFQKASRNSPSTGRTKRYISTIIIPEAD